MRRGLCVPRMPKSSGSSPFVFAQVKHGVGIDEIVGHVLQPGSTPVASRTDTSDLEKGSTGYQPVPAGDAPAGT
jgi:hypothetical protein